MSFAFENKLFMSNIIVTMVVVVWDKQLHRHQGKQDGNHEPSDSWLNDDNHASEES